MTHGLQKTVIRDMSIITGTMAEASSPGLRCAPGAGPELADLDAGSATSYRQLCWKSYRIVYVVIGKVVNIVLVAEGDPTCLPC